MKIDTIDPAYYTVDDGNEQATASSVLPTRPASIYRLLMRQLIGVGTPRGLQGRLIAVVATFLVLIRWLWEFAPGHRRPERRRSAIERQPITESVVVHVGLREMAFTTGC